jgi:general secretion pathway protein H
MGKPVVTEKMQTSAAGSPKPQAGFTLLELLVVVAIVAMVSAGVGLSMRDASAVQLERDGERLAALLESARARSRVLGVAVRWRATPEGFKFEGLPASDLPETWLDANTRVASPQGGSASSATLLLGPDPLIEPQELVLTSLAQPGKTVRLATDGVRPFAVKATP